MKQRQRAHTAIALACTAFVFGVGNVYAASCTDSTAAFSICDEFNGTTLDTSVWKVVSGGTGLTSVHDGYLDLAMNQASQGDVVFTEFAEQNRIKLTINHNMHTNGAYFLPNLTLRSSDSRDFITLSFKRATWEAGACTGASGNDDKVVLSIANSGDKGIDLCSAASARSFYDKWTKTIIEYNADTGLVTVDLGGDGTIDIQTTVPTANRKYVAGVSIAALGWWTGHWYKVDSIRVEGGSSAAPTVQDVECFFNWGEKQVPQHLTPHQNTKSLGTIHYRGPYAGGVYVGRQDSSVIATGGALGSSIATLGVFSEFLAAARAANCGGTTVVKPDTCVAPKVMQSGKCVEPPPPPPTCTPSKVLKDGQCVDPLVPSSCAPKSIDWTVVDQVCQASTTSTASGQNTILTSTNGKTGSATVVCTNGEWGPPQATTCAAPPANSCAAESLSWTVSGQICQTTSAVTIAGQTAQLDSTNGKTGKATFVCNNGQWGKPQQVTQADTCAETPALLSFLGTSETLSGQSVFVSLYGADAEKVNKATLGDGTNCSISSTRSIGTQLKTFECPSPSASTQTLAYVTLNYSNGRASTKVGPIYLNPKDSWVTSNGQFYVDGAKQAVLVQKTDGSVDIDYVVGSLTGNSGDAPNWKDFAAVQVSYVGNTTVLCPVSLDIPWHYTCPASPSLQPGEVTLRLLRNGGVQSGITLNGNPIGAVAMSKDRVRVITQAQATANGIPLPTETVTVKPSCDANASISWTSAEGTCSGAIQKSNVSTSLVPVTNSATSYSGSASFACTTNTDGITASWKQQGSSSCVKSTPATCAPTTVNWGSSCSASIGSGNVSSQPVLLSYDNSGVKGNATFKCEVSSGGAASWVTDSTATCDPVPTAASCPSSGVTKTWVVNGTSCSGTTTQTSTISGNLASFKTTTGNTGEATFACTNGQWNNIPDADTTPTCSDSSSLGGGTVATCDIFANPNGCPP